MENMLVNFTPKRTATSTISAPTGKKPRIESTELFDGSSEIVIVHQKEEYSLRITRNGKLILTK
jgi:hemin uptake protein HemP